MNEDSDQMIPYFRRKTDFSSILSSGNKNKQKLLGYKKNEKKFGEPINLIYENHLNK